MSKKALLMVHFGTTHDDTRAKTIESMNKKFSDFFSDCDFYEAYTSRIILKKLKDRDIIKNSPLKSLDIISEKGYDELYVQSSHIIAGLEYENLLDEIKKYENKFKNIYIGKPLLYDIEDYHSIVDILKDEYVPKEKNAALVLVCHGTDSPVGACYSMIEYVFDEHLYENVYVVSTKAYPLMNTLLKKLKKDNIRKVILAPFMFVAGEHAKNDMAISYKNEIEEAGIEVAEVILKGLGEFESIQDIFLKHLQATLKNKNEDSLADFKKNYSNKYSIE